MLIEHGWLELDGRIVDPTLPDLQLSYFPGLRLSAEEATLAATKSKTKRGELPIAWRYGWGGGDHPSYMAAFNAALAFTRELFQFTAAAVSLSL